MSRATELLEDAQKLSAAIEAYSTSRFDNRGRLNGSEALSLIAIETDKLTMLVAGRSPHPEWSVYLSVSSLNKGLIEVGGDWREDPHLTALANALTEKAYSFYRDVRPALG